MRDRKTWLILLLVAMMALWGCSDDDDDNGTNPPEPSVFETVAKALDEYIAMRGELITAQDLNAELDQYEVLDVRREDDYDAGHIEDAVWSALGDAVTTVQAQGWAMDQKIAICCYTGQSARFAQIALMMHGYTNVKSLKFGMSAWNTSLITGYWRDPTRTDFVLDAALIETAVNDETAMSYDYPSPVAETVTGCADWLLSTVASTGFGEFAVSTDQLADDVENATVDWYVVNYHPFEVYNGPPDSEGVPGHIMGAYCYPPGASLAWGQKLEHLPTDQPIAVYCWTGQTSAFATAYLRMLGYDAHSVVQGCNDMFYDLLTGHKWSDPGLDYPLIPTE